MGEQVKRYYVCRETATMEDHPSGEWITHDDHLAALASARAEVEALRSPAVRDVTAERRRQTEAEGWTIEHDDEHSHCELASAALCYCASAVAWGANRIPTEPPWNWPWEGRWWKPKNQRADLVRAGALILAEIERLDRDAARRRVEGEEARS